MGDGQAARAETAIGEVGKITASAAIESYSGRLKLSAFEQTGWSGIGERVSPELAVVSGGGGVSEADWGAVQFRDWKDRREGGHPALWMGSKIQRESGVAEDCCLFETKQGGRGASHVCVEGVPHVSAISFLFLLIRACTADPGPGRVRRFNFNDHDGHQPNLPKLYNPDWRIAE